METTPAVVQMNEQRSLLRDIPVNFGRPWYRQNTKARILFLLVGCILDSFALSALAAPTGDLAKRKLAWTNELNRMSFGTPNECCGLIDSLQQFHAQCEVCTVFDPRQGESLKYNFVQDGKTVVSLRGHIKSAFIGSGDRLYFADYPMDSFGCTVSAYDLHSGKKLWSTQLHGERPKGHSAYSNFVWMRMSDPNEAVGEANGAAIVVTGAESYCDYAEILDSETGASLALKIYRVGFGSPPATVNVTDKKKP
jgi:hypothetical protein